MNDSRQHPTLETPRLFLRMPLLSDAEMVARWLSDEALTMHTTDVPFPYTLDDANYWLTIVPRMFEHGDQFTFGMVLKEESIFVGMVSLTIDHENHHAALGYWIGKPYWNRGLATEAARAAVDFGLNTLRLHRIYARYFSINPASGRVMEKIGMRFEGCMRGHILKDGIFYDINLFGILAGEPIF